MEIEINRDKFNELKKGDKVFVAKYFATWCGPCQMFAPVFKKAAEEYKDFAMFEIDIDKETALAAENGVTGVPTVVAYKNGKELARFSGFRPLEDLKKWLADLK